MSSPAVNSGPAALDRKVWTELSRIFAHLTGPERDAILSAAATRCYALRQEALRAEIC